jgi:hypothetical protein
MVEADIAEGEIGQITQAIQNALRGPSQPAVRRLAAVTPQVNGGEPAEVEEVDAEIIEETEDAASAPRQRAERKPAPTPDPLPIDFNAFDPTLNTFVSQYKADSHQQRYLIAAAWFHDHGGVTKVTPAHIYTAYRWLKWPLTVKDFAQPLRDLKGAGLFTSSEKGSYTLHHLGIQRVAELNTGSAG